MTSGPAVRWNNNIHYHRRILDAVPAGARTALDVGTGNGLLAAELHQRVPEVTAVDPDATVLASARTEDEGVRWVQGDVLTYPFPPASFDVVASVAALHHLPDLDRALARLAELTAPGGVVAVVGLARSSRPLDALYDVAGLVQQRRYRRRYGIWEHSAPMVWPPPHTYAAVRRSAARVLPGAAWSRLPMWRYSLVWRKPPPA
ncbi:class I SAM-dependent methyltransferase [Georgenia sp. TF02-10]|uniref:class I SAM-dependent methyltransferase n=1 Tax=Georgenia sp. TF02-10 TaxID=2917725 RepID=UPI001FA76D0C|nr:class I SAM-dependent methyltransferase [Georgenia sp. TF02-10]UNX54757.1 class I SAM-dependent methyltransferase [Georgenia sp. TF02-10]